VGGAVYAVQDRCAHRGTRFSTRPECYTANTVTCWYHGFTYDVRDGRLVAIVTDPESALIGKLHLRTYPVVERKGLVFVFVGDLDPPPPLAADVQPGLLDADLAIVPRGEQQVVASNWRLAAENGFDAAHIYIHRNSPLLTETRVTLPLGAWMYSREGMVVAPEEGPKGVVKGAGQKALIWEAQIEGTTVAARFRPGQEGVTPFAPDVSMWLPCGLVVDGFPLPGTYQFEWYVPIDERSHRYVVTWGRRVASEAEAAAFYAEIDARWRDLVVNQFNNDDVAAREGMEEFYGELGGWEKERLFRPDILITEWRKLAHAHGRTIQRERR
jgi:carbazole 1,9a-dioxygenase terminal dioxygenase component